MSARTCRICGRNGLASAFGRGAYLNVCTSCRSPAESPDQVDAERAQRNARLVAGSAALAATFQQPPTGFDKLLGHLSTWNSPAPERSAFEALENLRAGLEALVAAEQEHGVEVVQSAVEAHLAIRKARTT